MSAQASFIDRRRTNATTDAVDSRISMVVLALEFFDCLQSVTSTTLCLCYLSYLVSTTTTFLNVSIIQHEMRSPRRAPDRRGRSRTPYDRSSYKRSGYHRGSQVDGRSNHYDQRRPQSQGTNVDYRRERLDYDDRDSSHHDERRNNNRRPPALRRPYSSYTDPDHRSGETEYPVEALNYGSEYLLSPNLDPAPETHQTQVTNSRAEPHPPPTSQSSPDMPSTPSLAHVRPPEQKSHLNGTEPDGRPTDPAGHSVDQISTFSGQGVWNHHRPHNKVGPQCQKQRDKLIEELSKFMEEGGYIMTDSIIAVDIQPKDLPSDPRDLATGMLEQVVALWTLAEGNRDLVFEYQRKAVMERQGGREKCYVGSEDLSRAQILLARFQGSEEAAKVFENVESESNVNRETTSSSTSTAAEPVDELVPDAAPQQQSASVHDQEGGGATEGERRFAWTSAQSSSGSHQTQEEDEGSVTPIHLPDRVSRPYGGVPALELARTMPQDTGLPRQLSDTQGSVRRRDPDHEQSQPAPAPDNVEHESNQQPGHDRHQDQPAAIPTNIAAFLQNHDQLSIFSNTRLQRPLQGTEFSYIEVSTNTYTTYTSPDGATVRQETQRREKHSIRSNN